LTLSRLLFGYTKLCKDTASRGECKTNGGIFLFFHTFCWYAWNTIHTKISILTTDEQDYHRLISHTKKTLSQRITLALVFGLATVLI